MASPSSDNIPPGFIGEQTPNGEWNKTNFQIQQSLLKMNTSTLVRVESCTNEGGVSPVGFVNITPMVNQVDAAGNPIPHVTIFNIPYSRIQGGTDAVIIDPKQGDIGIALFASRDISKVKNTKKQGNPGSNRTFSFSDAMYIGGLLNGAPTQYVQFSNDGINITSPTKVEAVVGDNKVTLDTGEWNVLVADQTLKLDATSLWHNGVNVGATHVHWDPTNTFIITGVPVGP